MGAQWGDEGKGKVIDIMASKADVVVRATGGNNAGHTVVSGGKTYKLHLVPSGILYEGTVCCIGPGCVVDPLALLREMEEVEANGTALDGLRIDYRAHIVMPYHLLIDELSENAKGENGIGTTKKGIGPCYMDKAERSGIRMIDFIPPEIFREKLFKNIEIKNKMLQYVYGGETLDAEAVFEEYSAYAEKLKPYVCDTSVLVYDAIKQGKNVLFEGAQGTFLDIDVGTYPYVTSSHPTAGGFCIGAGVGPTLIQNCIGVAKSYITRVGKGPFPTELNDEIGDRIRTKGGEFGTVTGRPRRTGWFDAVILRYSVRVNGLTALAINKLDTLTGIKTLKVAVAYKKNGQTIKDFPVDISLLEGCEPVYEELPGWDEDISACKRFEDLPANAQKYIEFIEKHCDCPVKMVGVGPDRTQNINR